MHEDPFIDFKEKWVIVTGASSGIGRAIAVQLAHLDARLILIGRNEERLKETAAQLESTEYHILCFDLVNLSEISDEINKLVKNTGRIYGLCHCAGIVETRPLSSFKADNLVSMIDINLISGLEISRVICRRDIMEEEGGSILFISSIYGIVGMAGQIGYSASKGAVVAAARSMAIELARKKIRVNTISPGLVRTAMTDKSFSLLSEGQVQEIEKSFPLGTGTPEDVARAAAFLLAPQNKWITGLDMIIDGGYTAH
jgi:NAD(P)-dependent dehydrogenase (short-subunit alcohol dehydrogenase family)